MINHPTKGKIIRKRLNSKNALVKRSFSNQISWYQELGPHLKDYLPKFVGQEKEKDSTWYDLEYLNQGEYQTFSQILFSDDFDHKNMIIDSFLDFQEKMYLVPCQKTFENSLNLMQMAIADTIQQCQTRPFFNQILNQEMIINGKKVPSLIDMIDQINLKELQILKPNKMCYFHGDLHPENMLVKNSDPIQLKFIDPVAPLGVYFGDLAFDLAKINSYLSGILFQLRRGLYDLKINGIKVDYRFKYNKSLLDFINSKAVLYFNQKIKERIIHNHFIDDKSYKKRMLFYDFLYYLTMVPIVKKPQNKMRYILALESLNKFVEEIKN